MITNTMPAGDIAGLEHDEAMRLATDEYTLLLALADDLRDADWTRPTDCAGWDVRAILGHMLGMLKLQADPQERLRQVKTAAEIAAQTGGLRLDAMTALQVREHAHLTTGQLTAALHQMAPLGLAARRATTAEQRAVPYSPELPGEGQWTMGYLFDVIHTRDPWMHRVDICRATGRDPVMSPGHDGRIVADVVADWARRHGKPFTLILTGPAGGSFGTGDSGPELELDAVEFCRILSGRGADNVLLTTAVPF